MIGSIRLRQVSTESNVANRIDVSPDQMSPGVFSCHCTGNCSLTLLDAA